MGFPFLEKKSCHTAFLLLANGNLYLYNIRMTSAIVPLLHEKILNLKSKANGKSDVNWPVDLKTSVSAETAAAEWVSPG